MNGPADAAIRTSALDPGRSFIVQAPAGSGKTELLIQRYLRLLTIVDAPEEILAVTFTRKAAAEMRSRVIEAITRAANREIPTASHLALGYDLACQAVARDEALGWGLLSQPSRLRISTIDSVNTRLSRLSPLSASSAGAQQIVDDARSLYEEAARDTISLASESGPFATAIRHVLAHYDNQADRVMRLLAKMLANRDQWLRYTGAGLELNEAGVRSALESALHVLVERELARADALLPRKARAAMLKLLRYAGASLASLDIESDIRVWQNYEDFPSAEHENLRAWRGLALGLLTKQGQWRKASGVNKGIGFPTGNSQMKSDWGELLEGLKASACSEQLKVALAQVQQLPEARYTDAQWHELRSLLKVLPLAAANLQQVFSARGQVDFSQVARDALNALGHDDEPSELTLALDYSLKHILLDEYQDTSRSQFELLQRLTAGWQADDGRSLFLVGDPMQSIYRFREADVRVYLDTQADGIGELQPESLRLESNFRSSPVLVDWVNRVFAKILPAEPDRELGAVPFSPSHAQRPAEASAAVRWEVLAEADSHAEAERVLAAVKQCLDAWPDGSIGILVRSRRHAQDLLARLREAEIDFVAPGLELLVEVPAIQNLLGLTRALLHPADRIAWLAILRAPWCGLTLADLHALAGRDHGASIWSLLQGLDSESGLSADGYRRAVSLRESIRPWLSRRGACCLRELVEGCWTWLGGPATLDHGGQWQVVAEYFAFLEQHETGGDYPDIAQLHLQLQERTVTRTASESLVQVMTMHKAKGLEFDTVLLPGLGFGTKHDDKPSLLWRELSGAGSPPPLVLAPQPATGDEDDRIYALLWRYESQRRDLELSRLLYVATTRARARLWLFAIVKRNKQGEWQALRSDSLLSKLWPVCQADITFPDTDEEDAEQVPQADEAQWFSPSVRRLPDHWKRPEFLQANPPAWTVPATVQPEPEFDWASRWAMHVGTVVHRWLEEIARGGVEAFSAERIAGLRPNFRRQLQRLGTAHADLERASQRVAQALRACIADEQGRWLLSKEHRATANELALVQAEAGEYRQMRIDRSFVDEHDVRWIVDYKTSVHEGKDLEAFLVSESDRYRGQLRAYRDAYAAMESRRIRSALYFPLLGVLREVDVDAQSGVLE